MSAETPPLLLLPPGSLPPQHPKLLRVTTALPSPPTTSTRAETDMYFAEAVQQAGSIGKFYHFREIMSIDKQTTMLSNRQPGIRKSLCGALSIRH
jgi:hypothetical protein